MKPRPALYMRSLLVAGPMVLIGATLLLLNGIVWLAVLVVGLSLVAFLGPWLLSPYSKTARRLLSPSDERFERLERLADWLGRVPVFGRIWRLAERATGNEGRSEAEAYRRWRREHHE